MKTRGWQSGTLTDRRSWFNHLPVFGTVGTMLILHPSEFDIETLGPRAAASVVREAAAHYQQFAFREGWLR